MGTPDFAAPSLKMLVHGGFAPVAVVTGMDKPRGRGRSVRPTPVAAMAQALGIDAILQPASVRDPAFADQITALRPDVIAVVAFRILPRAVFAAATMGAFNLHASLLPAYRGAAPIHRALMAGETETGVTTFFLEDRVDTGSIILRWSTHVEPEETAGEVHDRLSELGARAVLETVRMIASGPVPTQEQRHASASPAPKISKEERRISWDKPAAHVHNHCRGLSPHPGAWTRHGQVRLKILRTRLSSLCASPGRVFTLGARLLVGCAEGSVEILTLQQEGRRPLDAAAFLRGYTMPEGAQVA